MIPLTLSARVGKCIGQGKQMLRPCRSSFQTTRALQVSESFFMVDELGVRS